MNLSNSPHSVFLSTTNADETRAFYNGLLGFPEIDDSPFAIVFQMASAELRISKVDEHQPPPWTVLDWIVDDVEAAVDQLKAKGVEPADFPGMEVDDRGIWTAPGSGARICWFRDPAGYVLSISQRP